MSEQRWGAANQPRRFGVANWVSGAVAVALVAGALASPLVGNPSMVYAAPLHQMGNSLSANQDALANLYSNVSPSVVNIQVTSRMASFPGFSLPDDEEGPLQQSVGSGFIYDDLGHIVTNNHVVEDAEEILVSFSNGFWAEAEVVATDPQADLAVIKVTPPEGVPWKPLPLAEPNSLRVGHSVIAIGNPFGLGGTLTSGVVSAIGRGIPLGTSTTANYTLPDVIQTDAAINPGNSGGPLLDINGNVVGVNFAIRSQESFNAGVGFAIPVSIVRRVVPALIEDGRYAYSYLGLTGNTINPFLAKALEMPDNRLGVYISTVLPGGPSEAAGIQGGTETIVTEDGFEFQRGGDIVIAVDTIPVTRFEDLVSYLVTRVSPGDEIVLTVLRGDETLDIAVTLGERPAAPVTATTPNVVPEEADGISSRQAMAIATAAAEEEGLLTSDIIERTASQDEVDGVAVWYIELVTEDETVVAIVDLATGEVLGITAEE